MKIYFFIIILFSSVTPAIASEAYDPLFKIELPNQQLSSVVRDYVNATESKNEIIAITNWETYLNEYAYEGPSSVEDLTHLVFIRQAHFELARLYYLQGRQSDADAILKSANEFIVYTSPELSNGKSWCKIEGYCQ